MNAIKTCDMETCFNKWKVGSKATKNVVSIFILGENLSS